MRSQFRRCFEDLATDQRNELADEIVKVGLLLLSFVYWLGVVIHRGLYRYRVIEKYRLPAPVVSVGNVTWGGSGKTPLVGYLAEKLSDTHPVAILTRGYGHDEPLQLSQHLRSVTVITGKNRIGKTQAFLQHRLVDVFLLDDGFQHWPLDRDLEIVVVNALNPFGNRYLLPRGILREPINALRRADLVVLTHANLVSSEQLQSCLKLISPYVARENILLSKHEPIGFVNGRTQQQFGLEEFRGTKMMVVCGIGAPDSFLKTLEQLGIGVERAFIFEDHHEYEDRELKQIRKTTADKIHLPFVTTEKDWVRCPLEMGRYLDPLVLKVEIRILENEKRLIDRLHQLFSR